MFILFLLVRFIRLYRPDFQLVAKITQIRAEKRPNSSAEIWQRRKNAVPLQCDSKHS